MRKLRFVLVISARVFQWKNPAFPTRLQVLWPAPPEKRRCPSAVRSTPVLFFRPPAFDSSYISLLQSLKRHFSFVHLSCIENCLDIPSITVLFCLLYLCKIKHFSEFDPTSKSDALLFSREQPLQSFQGFSAIARLIVRSSRLPLVSSAATSSCQFRSEAAFFSSSSWTLFL